METESPLVALGPRLGALVSACEKLCVADCCGIDAFDFSSLHMASHLAGHSGAITEEELVAIEAELEDFVARVELLEPDEDGLVCGVESMNQFFTREGLDALVGRLRVNVRLAPELLEHAKRLEEGLR